MRRALLAKLIASRGETDDDDSDDDGDDDDGDGDSRGFARLLAGRNIVRRRRLRKALLASLARN